MKIKLTALVLAFILCLTISMPCFETVSAATQGTYYETAVGLLSKIGVLEENSPENFNVDKNMTRAEFVVMLLKAKGIQTMATPEVSFFTDVEISNWAAGYINAAVDMGMINGYPDGSFKPNNNISIFECIKLAVDTANYGFQTEGKGGYPSAYLSVGWDIGISSGLEDISDRPATAGEAALITFHMLETNWMIRGSHNGMEKYTEDKTRTMLSEVFGIYKGKGIMSGTEETRLSNPSGVGKGEVEISGRSYELGDSNAKKFLGYSVRFYYKNGKDNSNDELIYVSGDSKNDDIVVKSTEIESFENLTYRYYTNMDESSMIATVKVSATSDIIYNGKALIGAKDDSLFIPKSGNVILIDNNGDGICDVVKINNKNLMLVESVDKSNYIIYDQLVAGNKV